MLHRRERASPGGNSTNAGKAGKPVFARGCPPSGLRRRMVWLPADPEWQERILAPSVSYMEGAEVHSARDGRPCRGDTPDVAEAEKLRPFGMSRLTDGEAAGVVRGEHRDLRMGRGEPAKPTLVAAPEPLAGGDNALDRRRPAAGGRQAGRRGGR